MLEAYFPSTFGALHHQLLAGKAHFSKCIEIWDVCMLLSDREYKQRQKTTTLHTCIWPFLHLPSPLYCMAYRKQVSLLLSVTESVIYSMYLNILVFQSYCDDQYIPCDRQSRCFKWICEMMTTRDEVCLIEKLVIFMHATFRSWKCTVCEFILNINTACTGMAADVQL